VPNQKPKDSSQLIPFPGATDLHFRLARSLELINIWNGALSGQFLMQDVLMVLTRHIAARNIVFYRYEKERPQTIAAVSRLNGAIKPEVSSGSLLRYLLDHHAEAMQPGAIFGLSSLSKESNFDQTPAQREWAARPDIIENSLFIMGATDGWLDVIEANFDVPPRTSPEIPARLISIAMANAWKIRAPGVITRQIRDFARARGRSAPADGTYILGPDNPAGLSRAEQRVCRLLVGGDTARDIADVLGLSLATIRTHLRNIYSKTGTDGQLRLIALIKDCQDVPT
jgi:DNA-binding CsgD family transcriptional regulator